MEGNDVEDYHNGISDWFQEVLPKEGIEFDFIEKAILKLSPNGKECIIQAQGREFRAFISYR